MDTMARATEFSQRRKHKITVKESELFKFSLKLKHCFEMQMLEARKGNFTNELQPRW